MTIHEFWQFPLGAQAAIGFGYLAYITAYAGMRRGHPTKDAIFISLAFGSISLLAFTMLGYLGSALALFTSLLVTIIAAIIWRTFGRGNWRRLMEITGVHRDDGIFYGWDAIAQTKGEVGQASVHTKDGRVLYLNDRTQFRDAPWQGLYLGGDGSVIMIVEEEELPSGGEESRTGILHEQGTRMTYIPAAEIKRVNIRIR